MATPTNPPNNNALACVALVAIIGFFALVSQCSGPNQTDNASPLPTLESNESAAVQQPAPPDPIAKDSIDRAATHFRLALGAEGFGGAMIYSQNCFDALSRDFSWVNLDRCGAFDMIAVRAMLDSDVTGLDNEAAYFQTETAAGRYLAAAIAGGEKPEDADRRLSDLQARASKARLPAPTKPVADEEPDSAVPSTEIDNDSDDTPMDDVGEELDT